MSAISPIAATLTPQQIRALQILAIAEKPLRNGDFAKRSGQRTGWSKALGPCTKRRDHDPASLWFRGLVSVTGTTYVITSLGRDMVQPQRGQDLFRLPEEIPSGADYSEGSVQRILVNRYERDSRARDECIGHYGTACCLCSFDFVSVYGEVMAGFIHVHHLKPLSGVGPDYKVDAIRDLRPVCPNCHAVLHRRDPPYSLEEVRQFLQAHRA